MGMFTGGLDVELTEAGRRQSVRAGELLRDFGVEVDLVLCSPLTRARETARIVLAALPAHPELIVEWRLSERSYGALTGRSKAEVLRQVGEEAFLTLRRSLDGRRRRYRMTNSHAFAPSQPSQGAPLVQLLQQNRCGMSSSACGPSWRT